MAAIQQACKDIVTMRCVSGAVVMAALLLAACQANATPDRSFPSGDAAAKVDASLVSGQPCAAPCWQGIQPGVTTFDAAQASLQKLGFVKETRPYPESREIEWKSALTDYGGGVLTFDNAGMVEEIAYTLEFRLTAAELIDAQGKPDGLVVFGIPNGAGEIQLIWAARGLVGRIPLKRLDKTAFFTTAPVQPTTRIDAVILSAPITDLDRLTTDRKNTWYPWNDYQPLPQ